MFCSCCGLLFFTSYLPQSPPAALGSACLQVGPGILQRAKMVLSTISFLDGRSAPPHSRNRPSFNLCFGNDMSQDFLHHVHHAAAASPIREMLFYLRSFRCFKSPSLFPPEHFALRRVCSLPLRPRTSPQYFSKSSHHPESFRLLSLALSALEALLTLSSHFFYNDFEFISRFSLSLLQLLSSPRVACSCPFLHPFDPPGLFSAGPPCQ